MTQVTTYDHKLVIIATPYKTSHPKPSEFDHQGRSLKNQREKFASHKHATHPSTYTSNFSAMTRKFSFITPRKDQTIPFPISGNQPTTIPYVKEINMLAISHNESSKII